MSRHPVPGFWRERARGVGYLVLLGGAILASAVVIAVIALVVAP